MQLDSFLNGQSECFVDVFFCLGGSLAHYISKNTRARVISSIYLDERQTQFVGKLLALFKRYNALLTQIYASLMSKTMSVEQMELTNLVTHHNGSDPISVLNSSNAIVQQLNYLINSIGVVQRKFTYWNVIESATRIYHVNE